MTRLPAQEGALLILKERRGFLSPLATGQTEPPFECLVSQGEISLTVPAYARVSVINGFSRKSVHDGQKWGREGISAASKRVTLQFPISTEIRVCAHGREWEIYLQTPAIGGGRPSANRLSSREWVLLLTSIGGHAALFLALVSLGSGKAGQNETKKNFLVAEKPLPVQKGGGSSDAGVSTYVPFAGMSYSKFLNQLAAKEFAADPAAALLKSVAKLDKGVGGKRAAIGKGVKSNAEGIGSGDGTGPGTGDALTGVIARQKFTEGSGGGVDNSKNLNDRQRALLRAKFRELQGDFQRLYSRLLSADPKLQVTVSLECKVLPNGFLSVAGFKARGTYQPDSLLKLRGGMAEIIQNSYVGTEFAGIVLRGENVFVR